jgi:hypothetical protein
MDDFWNEIPMPTEAERDAAVARILDAGLPARPGFRHSLTETWKAVGLRALFFGAADCLFLAVLFLLVCLLPAAAAAARQESVGPALFLLSPALYAALHLLTAWKESQSGTLEWRQSCRVSLRTMTALRMLVFGSVSVLVCVPTNGLLWYLAGGKVSLSWMVALSVSSLCLYGALSLYCLRLRGTAGLLTAPVAWAALGIVPLLWQRAARWLDGVPTVLFCLLAAAALALYFTELRRFCRRPTEGGTIYALG